MRPKLGTVLAGILAIGILLGFALFSALLGQTAAGPPGSAVSAGPHVTDRLRAGCLGGEARLDTTEVAAQADGVHIDIAGEEPGIALRFRNDAGYVVSPGVNEYGPSVISLSPGRWSAACMADKVKTFSSGVPLTVVDDGGFYVPAEPPCSSAAPSVNQAKTDRAWAHPESEIRRIADLDASYTVEPGGYVALAANRDQYESFTYRIVRDGEVVGRARIFRDGLSIFGCLNAP